MKAIVVKSFGGPEVMEYIDYKDPTPGSHQVLVKTRMIGVNYADTLQTDNTYLVQNLPPVIPGVEASFLIDGDICVGYTSSGSYAEKIVINKDRIFKVPKGVTEEEAMSVVCQGSTAYAIVNDMFNISPGDIVLINGASSAVGMILIQLCKLKGAIVIGVTSSQKKIDFIKILGVDFAFLDTEINKIVKEVGQRPKFIMESYGGKHFMGYYSMLATGGHICSYGASSREFPPSIEIRDLLKDTKTVSGFWGTALFFNDSDRLNKVVNNLFDLIKNKKIKIFIGDKMSLKDAKIMHEKIRDRLTLGKLILTNDI